MAYTLDFSSTFIIGRDKQIYKISDHFPQISENETIAVFVSGGMESTLIAKICFQLYGKDNTILVYTDELFAHDTHTKKALTGNLSNLETILNKELHFINAPRNLHKKDIFSSIQNINSQLLETFNSVYGLIGFTELFWELEAFKQPDADIAFVRSQFMSNPKKFYNLIEEFHFFTDSYTEHVLDIYIQHDTWKILRNPDIYKIVSPFGVINKHAVVDLYRQLGWWDTLLKTRSCVDSYIEETEKHCGKCFNCQQRHDGFDILGVEDPTEYTHNDVIIKRKNLRASLEYEKIYTRHS